MRISRTNIRITILLAAVGCFAFANSMSFGQEDDKKTTQPVFRVPKVANLPDTELSPEKKGQTITPGALATDAVVTPHPLDRAIEMAHNGFEHIQRDIFDYSAIMVKRERVDNTLGDPEYMRIKIRNPRKVNNVDVPFSVYMKFLKPKGVGCDNRIGCQCTGGNGLAFFLRTQFGVRKVGNFWNPENRLGGLFIVFLAERHRIGKCKASNRSQ